MPLPRHTLYGGILCASLASCYLSDDYSGGLPPESGDPTTEGGAAGQTARSGAGGVSGFSSGAGKGGASSAGKGGASAGTGGAPPGAGQGGTVSAGTGGKSTAGAPGQGGSGAGGTPTMQPPCAQLAAAHCQRLAIDCTLSYASMSSQGFQQCQQRTTAYCEAVRALPGVPSDISACTQHILNDPIHYGCEGLHDPFLVCHLPGAFPDGGPCANAAQCQGGLCLNQFASCGTCATLREAGQSCGSTPDEQCRAGLLCQDKICQAPSSSGGPCTYANECQQGLVCKDKTCQPAPPVGTPCVSFGECNERQGQYCSDMACQAPAMSLDGACGTLPLYIYCPLGQSCMIPLGSFSGQCVPEVPDGSTCDFFAGPCQPPAICDQGVCRLLPACAM